MGRLKAGKSTLVNALIGAPVSETAALEATNVVTVFQYGAPDRAEAVLKDGSRIPITTMRGQKTELPVPANTIAYVNRWITSSAVRDYSLIDTPGLATLTESNEGLPVPRCWMSRPDRLQSKRMLQSSYLIQYRAAMRWTFCMNLALPL